MFVGQYSSQRRSMPGLAMRLSLWKSPLLLYNDNGVLPLSERQGMSERRFVLVDFTYMNHAGYLRLSKFIYAPTSKRHVLQDAGEPRRVRLHVHGRRAVDVWPAILAIAFQVDAALG